MKNFTQWEGELAAIGTHIFPTLGIESTSSNTSIVNGFDKDKKKVIYVMMFVNYNLVSSLVSYLQPHLNPHVHATMNNKQLQITYYC